MKRVMIVVPDNGVLTSAPVPAGYVDLRSVPRERVRTAIMTVAISHGNVVLTRQQVPPFSGWDVLTVNDRKSNDRFFSCVAETPSGFYELLTRLPDMYDYLYTNKVIKHLIGGQIK